MRKFAAFVLPLLLVLALGAAGCGKGSTPSSNTVSMTSADFTTKSITISAGQAVNFTNPSGSTHLLCLGKVQKCDTTIKDGPPALSVSSGHEVEFDAGHNQSFTFPTKGDFPVTCTVHPNMDMVVHVQ